MDVSPFRTSSYVSATRPRDSGYKYASIYICTYVYMYMHLLTISDFIISLRHPPAR